MLEGVVRVGQGMAANLTLPLPAKTGTALLTLPAAVTQRHFRIEFWSASSPLRTQLYGMVVVDGPHQYGAVASAPVFATIVRDALQELGIPPHKTGAPAARGSPRSPYYDEGEAAGPVLPAVGHAARTGVAIRGAASTTSTTTIVTTTTTTWRARPPLGRHGTTTTPITPTSTPPVTQATTTLTASHDYHERGRCCATVVEPAQGSLSPRRSRLSIDRPVGSDQ